MKILVHNKEETKDLAKTFLNSLRSGERAVVVALKGELGAGKTNFTQIIGQMLGIKENMHSPTFVIQKYYEINPEEGKEGWQGFKKLLHIDAYRLEDEQELLNLGWDEMLNDPTNLIFIEWPENVAGAIPEYAKEISFEHIDENTREISLSTV